jgi:hypothetical protein
LPTKERRGPEMQGPNIVPRNAAIPLSKLLAMNSLLRKRESERERARERARERERERERERGREREGERERARAREMCVCACVRGGEFYTTRALSKTQTKGQGPWRG